VEGQVGVAAISKRLRYEVMRRDGHACYYCGRKPPEVKLTVDHVVPVALGGTDEPSNLVSACGDCNSGKTSSSPDAPVVAAVADNAAAWASAVQVAAETMRTEVAAGTQACEQFDETWSRLLGNAPRSDDWCRSVEAFVRNGLPIEVLQNCVSIAAASRAPAYAKWRYMCKVAWARLGEIQERASASRGAPPPDDEETPPEVTRGRADLACELLGDLSLSEIDRLKAEAREERQAETEDEQHIEAAHIAWRELWVGRDWFHHSILKLLEVLPDGMGHEAMRMARNELYSEQGAEFSKEDFYERAVELLTDRFRYECASDYLAKMPPGHSSEWLDFATNCFTEPDFKGPRRATRFRVTEAATCARWVIENRGWYRDMCSARGKRIPSCPNRAAWLLRTNEFGCCKDATGDDHGHQVCNQHLEKVIDGDMMLTDGSPITASNFFEYVPVATGAPF
jgi:hypothetical protein